MKMLERVGEGRAIPVKECLYPKCEECDDYHGQYCTVPIVVSKQIYRLFEDKIASMEKMITELEKLVTDEILGDVEPIKQDDLNLTWDDYLKGEDE